MTHLEIENLASDYLEELLEPSVRAAVEAHLSGCGACRELVGDVRQVLEMCRTAEDPQPNPWLVSKILRATAGERKPTWREQVAEFFRPVLQPRIAYPIAMTVFTFSVIVNAAGLDLRALHWEDLNPHTWLARADRQGHLIYARAEKFYYDLRVVYEIESRFREVTGQPQGQEEETPKPAAPPGGSSQGTPSDQTVASNYSGWTLVAVKNQQSLPKAGYAPGLAHAGRSPIQ